ncbi:MAG: peptidase M14, partial [Calditrichaeota bacterium]
MRRWSFSVAVIFLALTNLLAAQVTSPEKFLKFKIGADRKLADWKQITRYFEKLSRESDRVVLEQIGRSTEGRPLLLVVISSPQNLQHRAQIQRAMKKLADPRMLAGSEKQQILQTMPAVVLFNCSIHSTEIAASQFSMQFAYQLASAQDPETREILDNVVTLLIPSPNPDGIDIVVDWYRNSLGKPHEGLGPPKLYHAYAGHDNNRDWYMLNLKETRAITRVLYKEWFPQIVYDLHQMGRSSARMVIPPFYQVTNPLIDPLIVREIMLIGGHMATALSAAGIKGVATESIYDMWWHGGFRTAPYFHNMVGLLTEAASAHIATPDTVHPNQLRGGRRGLPDVKKFQTNLPEPWTGGVWHLRDIIKMENVTTRSVLDVAARYRKMWLENFYLMGKRALERGRTQSPAAFIVPAKQHDPASARKMLEILMAQGVEVQQALQDFR